MRNRLRLKQKLPENLYEAYNSFDIVGDIAIIKLPPIAASLENAQNIAQAIMTVHKNVKTVLSQSSSITGDYRLRRLVHVAGENKTRTVHKESDCMFAVDVTKCYFSPRLSHERRRIAQIVKPSETVVNMFAGVGCFSILIAKSQPSARIYSIDINPAAVEFMQENVRRNRVFGQVVPLLGDSKQIVEEHLQGVADRVLMPLPEKALEYLPCVVSALKPTGGWIHFHSFEHATKTEKPQEKVIPKIKKTLDALNVGFEIPLLRVVRSTGPNWWHLVADIHCLI